MLLIYKSHGYDKFGQRTYMKYCNGAETFYTYEPQRRRLQGLKVDAGGWRTEQPFRKVARPADR